MALYVESSKGWVYMSTGVYVVCAGFVQRWMFKSLDAEPLQRGREVVGLEIVTEDLFQLLDALIGQQELLLLLLKRL